MKTMLFEVNEHRNNATPLTLHVLALPYLARGHLNPMLCFCDLLLSKKPDILVTFVVTEKWLQLIRSDKIYRVNDSIHFTVIRSTVPPEVDRAWDMGSLTATARKMEGPFLQMLDGLVQPPTIILADAFMNWASEAGTRRNIPVVSLWTQPASVLSILCHLDLLKQNGHYPVNLSEHGDKLLDYIPGITPTRVADLPAYITRNADTFLDVALECTSMVSKSQCLLLTSFYELEALSIEALRRKLSMPIYSVGPSIPFHKLHSNNPNEETEYYLKWLDTRPPRSVLYISLGTSVSFRKDQLEEMIAGVQDSGANFLWVEFGKMASFITNSDKNKGRGLVVPWCNQLKVLCHNSIGGFWTHCGWNSTLEAIYSGVPMLTFPEFFDQTHNSKQIVEDWKIGFRAKKVPGNGELTSREEITKLIRELMDHKSRAGEEVRRRAKELQECCMKAIAEGGGPSAMNVDGFISDITYKTKQVVAQPRRCSL